MWTQTQPHLYSLTTPYQDDNYGNTINIFIFPEEETTFTFCHFMENLHD